MRYLILFFLSWIITTPCLAQKINYKDLYVLLNAKRYEEAEPFLRTFLADSKNADHANATFQMGNIYQDKALKADILADNDFSIAYADSAMLFYKTAIQNIDEKEIRKQDDYYTEYSRRDLRTGKIGIKLSDVHFDLQKRIEALQQRKQDVTALKKYYRNFTTCYNKAAETFNNFQQAFPEIKKLYFQSTDETIKNLESIKISYDSSRIYFAKYRSILDRSSEMGYNQQWEEEDLVDYSSADVSVDFLKDNIRTFDLGRWASSTSNIIKNDIKPLKAHILEYDKALDELYEKMQKDSLSVKSDITNLAERMLSHQLEKYDSNPLPVQVFKLRLAELDFLSSLLERRQVIDSADLLFQHQLIVHLEEQVNNIDSLITSISMLDLQDKSDNYKEFISTRYGSVNNLRQVVDKKRDFIINQRLIIELEKGNIENGLRHMLIGSELIPLFYDPEDSINIYRPLKIVEEKYSAGLFVPAGKIRGAYFTDINRERKSKVKVDIQLDSTKFLSSNLALTEILATSDQPENIFYVLVFQQSNGEDDSITYNAVMNKIYRTDGLAWSKEISWAIKPVDILYQPDTGNVIVSFEDESKTVISKETKK